MRFQGSNRLKNVIEGDVWDDMQVNGFGMRGGASAPDFKAFGPSGNLYCFSYAGSGPAQYAYFSIQMSHAYKEGSAIYPHIHWAPGNANAGNVKWFFEYSWASVNGTFGAPQILPVIDAADGVAWKHQIASFDTISGVGQTISSILICRLSRNSGDGDDSYAGDAFLLQCDLHYEVDSAGSRQELIK
jgi:hypothetical protein